jgi:translation initiation factor 1 (eIF-1/SUI1)
MDFDNFEETSEKELSSNKLEIRVVKNGRKSVTYLDGWELEKEDLKAHMKELKKKHGCNGSVKEKDGKVVFMLQGEKSDELIEYLKKVGIKGSDIKIVS